MSVLLCVLGPYQIPQPTPITTAPTPVIPSPVAPTTTTTTAPRPSTTLIAPAKEVQVPSIIQSTGATNAPLLVVKDYVRQGKKRIREDLGLQKCPITGQMVPTEQFTEHLRIVLLDPRWKYVKKKSFSRTEDGISIVLPDRIFLGTFIGIIGARTLWPPDITKDSL